MDIPAFSLKADIARLLPAVRGDMGDQGPVEIVPDLTVL
jgi:hypothetical protein